MSVVVTVPMHPLAAGGSDPTAQQQQPSGEEIDSVQVSVAGPDQIHVPAAANPEEEDVVVEEPPAGSYPEYGRCVSRSSQQQQQVMELRGWLMVLATVIASITYASGLNPPGGFDTVRQEIIDGVSPGAQPTSAASPAGPPAPGPGEHGIILALHEAGTRRYRAFYYCNTAAFSLSLSIVLLLASRDLRKLARTKVLEVLVALDVLALLLAYIAGSTFGVMEFGICSGIVLVVPLALVFMSCRLCGKYFWDEL